VVFADTPWVIAPDDRAQMVRNSLVRHWGRATLGVSRFYALGYDAYRLLPDILRQPSPGPFGAGEIAGATGMLYADGTGRIHRRLAFAQIRDGRPVSLPAAGPSSSQMPSPMSAPMSAEMPGEVPGPTTSPPGGS